MLADMTLTTQVGAIANHLLNNWEDVFAGATGIAIVGHAVNSFPTPNNVYGQWMLGVIKYAVGQRVSAANAINGYQTEVIATTDAQKLALQKGQAITVAKTNGPNSVLKDVASIDPATLGQKP